MTATHRFPLLLLAACALALGGARSSLAGSTAPAPSLDERIILVPPTGSEREDREIALWQGRIKASLAANQITPGSYERLGWAYISKARRTLDAGYYKLAEKTADVMDAHFGASDEALLLRGSVDHNLHRFGEAEDMARKLVARRGIAFDYALLSDALMEQGKLAESVQACQKMMALKPGVDAYSRAANLRWLTGDLPGAIVAMEAAVRAGSPLDATNTAWTLSRLSFYYLQAGRSADALRTAGMAQALVADYPPALLAQGRALLALGQTVQALAPLQRAERLNPLPEYQWWLADALRASGNPGGAVKIESEMKSRGEAADPRTFSLYLASRREDPADALRLATAELSNRGDVFTKDAVAWALESGGAHAEAEVAIQDALSAQTKDARLFLHAGEIALNRGKADSARSYFDQAEKFSGTLTPSERALLELRLSQRDGAPPPPRSS
jgi:tetratricopeptide (TPR) repeat protein